MTGVVSWGKPFRWLALLAAFGLLAACAPMQQQFDAQEVEPALTATHARMADGFLLPYRVWRAKRPKAILIALHGFNDYSNAFAAPGAWMRARGITTYAYDQRGFGKTRYRGLWAGAERMADDLAAFTRLVQKRHPGVPVVVMGVSMGGAVAMLAQTRPAMPAVRGLVLVAPAIWGWRAMNVAYRSGLWLAAHTVPWKTATGEGLGIQASDNIPMLRALARDELFIRKTRIDAIYGLVTLMDKAYASAPLIETPVLYLYGAKDQIVPGKPTLETVARITAKRRFVQYENGWHMLLRDLQAGTVYRDILAWLANPDAPLPSGEEVKGKPRAPRPR